MPKLSMRSRGTSLVNFGKILLVLDLLLECRCDGRQDRLAVLRLRLQFLG